MKILISDKLDTSALELLSNRGYELIEQDSSDQEKLAEAAAVADGWIIRSGTRITAELVNGANNLKVIGRAGVGVDNIDIDAATRRGIAVLNTPTGNTMAAVEHTMAMLLAMARHIPEAHQNLTEQGSWERSGYVGVELYGKTIGILGLGKIGSRVAARCRAMEMQVLGYDPFLSEEKAHEMGVELVQDLEGILARSDFLSLHLPASQDTKNLLDAGRLAGCKPGVRIVNCARGSLVDEQALADALREGQVAGAALDVFQNEPPVDSPLLGAPNVVVTPHLGASTVESQRKVGVQIAEQVADALEQGVFHSAVNIPVSDWATYSKIRPQLVLAERLGQVAQQYAGGGVSRVEVEYCGEGFAEIQAMNNILLKGLLRPVLGEGVNAVNSHLLAGERGISLACTERGKSSNYQSLVRLHVHVGEREHTLSGTIFTDDEPRLVEIDGFEVELFLVGNLMLFGNFDKPGVIGNVGTIMGSNDINIAHFTLGRRTIGGEALGVVAVDSRIGDDVIDQLSALPNMRWVRQVVIAE